MGKNQSSTHYPTMAESVSNTTKWRPEMQNSLFTALGELLRWYIYVYVYECAWIHAHALEVITPVNALPKQETLDGMGSFL